MIRSDDVPPWVTVFTRVCLSGLASLVHAACVVILAGILLFANGGHAAEIDLSIHPLAPPDTSSPRATIKTFLDNMGDAVRDFRGGHRKEALHSTRRAAKCLDLEQEPPAIRGVLGFYTTLYLKEILDRIELPSAHDIPDVAAVQSQNLSYWTIPHTEITLVAVKGENDVQRFLFSSYTVRHAEQFYNEVKQLPYKSGIEHKALLSQLRNAGSLVISKESLEKLPAWWRVEIYGLDVWQWTGLALYFSLAVLALLGVHKWGRALLGWLDGKLSTNLDHNIGGLLLPAMLLVLAKVGVWFLIFGLRFLNEDIYAPIAVVFLVVSYVASIWLIGALLNRAARVFVALGGFVKGGVDEQLIRMIFQIATVVVVCMIALDLGARLGLPTYSLVTGLGIGGLAVALAGREALSNIIGTIMIILDRPFKLGDYILLSDGERGKVTQVGLRSTRIRTRDDILISIPNSVIANAKMINESAPISMSRIRIKVGIAYGSDVEKAEHLLVRIAKQNATVLPEPVPRVRFRSFGDSTLNLELLCWIDLPQQRGRTIHELNKAINKEFREQDIQIPFPQRDVYIHMDK